MKTYTRRKIAKIIGVKPLVVRLLCKRNYPFVSFPPGYVPVETSAFRQFLRFFHRCGVLGKTPKKLRNQKELLAHYNISRHILNQWKVIGIPHYVFNRRTLRFDLREIDAWLVANNLHFPKQPPKK